MNSPDQQPSAAVPLSEVLSDASVLPDFMSEGAVPEQYLIHTTGAGALMTEAYLLSAGFSLDDYRLATPEEVIM